jgi:DNA oxidative demethylase
MTLFDPETEEGLARSVAPGAAHIARWMSLEQQALMVHEFYEWTRGPVPLRSASIYGRQMSVKTVCLGWHWQPNRYSREASDVNGARVLPFPGWMVDLGRRALRETGYSDLDVESYEPDAALVNFYDRNARMGMHQDRDERSSAPVVSLSIGDSCTFRFGNTENRNRPYGDVTLSSGSLFVFGGPSRLAFHGVTKVHPGTSPPGCGISEGRLNITMRVTGLERRAGN